MESESSDADDAQMTISHVHLLTKPLLIGQLIRLVFLVCQQYSILSNKLDQKTCCQISKLTVGHIDFCHCFRMTTYVWNSCAI